MILLTSTTSKLQAVTSSVADTDIYATWADNNVGAISFDSANFALSAAGTTDVVPVPGSGIQRRISGLSIRNKHASTSQDITVRHTNGTTAVDLRKETLLPGEELQYFEKTGFLHFNAAGSIKFDNISESVAHTWTGVQTFANGTLKHAGSTSGTITVQAAAVAGTNTITIPAATTTLAGLGIAQTFTAAQTWDLGGAAAAKLSAEGTYNLLSFNGSGTSSGVIGFIGGGSADANLYLLTPSTGNFNFRTAGTDFFTIGVGGSISVGVTGGAKGAGTLNIAGPYYAAGIGQGIWQNFTPTVTANAGTLGAGVSVSGSRYCQVGKLIVAEYAISIPANGTAASWIKVTTPISAAASSNLLGFGCDGGGNSLNGIVAGTGIIAIRKFDGTYPGGSGAFLLFTAVYEAA
jgi:hypothetical protein